MKSHLVLALLILVLGSTSSKAEDWALRLEYGAQVEFPFHEAFWTDLTATVEGWVRADPSATGAFAVYARWTAYVEDKCLWINNLGAVEEVSAYYAYSPWRLFSPLGAFQMDGEWHHVAYVRNAGDGSFRIFIDGALVAEATEVSGSVGGGDGISSVGFWRDGNTREDVSGFDIRELHVSDDALYDGPFTPSWHLSATGETVLLVRFDEGHGTTIGDDGPIGMIGEITQRGPQSTATWIRVDQPEPVLPVTMGTSWDGIPLQQILDEEYGPGAINVETDYEGYLAGDGDPAWWQDFGVNSILVREIAGWANRNTMGWYVETLSGPPTIDNVDDGVIFEGPAAAGAEFYVSFPANTRFGLWLNPNGDLDATNAPEPELFFTNRFYNDIGPDGSGALHAPFDGDVQCLIFNITHLRGGVPTYVVAWEDNDSGSPLSDSWSPTTTDNDYNDLVVEISAFSPVKVEAGSWGELKARYEE